jgi:hypothetical protein
MFCGEVGKAEQSQIGPKDPHTILSNRINNIVDLSADVAQSKVFLDLLLRGLLDEEIFLCPKFFSLPLETCFREVILRVLLEML